MSKIFVVGELRSFIEEQESLLSRNNVKLFSTATAEEALELHRNEQMDLIIADVDMPGMGGDELCARIREDEKLSKVYFLLICSGRKADMKKAERCGANSFITRPLDFSEIADYQCNEVIIPFWKKENTFAARHGVKIAFEAHPGFCVYNPETIVKLRKAAGRQLGANLDPSHFFWQGIDPVEAAR